MPAKGDLPVGDPPSASPDQENLPAQTDSPAQTKSKTYSRRSVLFALTSGLVGGAVVGGLGVHEYPRLTHDRSWEPGELVILSGADDSAGERRQTLIDQWNRLHREHQARVEVVPSISDLERHEMLARTRGDGGAVDILNLDVPWVPEFAADDLLREFDDDGVDLDAFLRKPLETCKYGGKLWGLPFNTDAGLLFWDKKRRKDPPTSWSDIERIASRVNSGEAALATQLADYEGLTVNTLEAVWSTGGEIVDDDGKVRVDSSKAQEGLLRLVNGAHSPQILSDSIGFDEDDTTNAFLEHRVVTMRNWPVADRYLDQIDSATGQKFEAGISTLPWPSVLGGQDLVVARRSKRPNAAMALIRFLTDARSQQILFEGGLPATQRVVYEDTRAQPQYREALKNAIENARLRPSTPFYWLFSRVLRNAVHSMLVNNANPPSDLAAKLRAALRGQVK